MPFYFRKECPLNSGYLKKLLKRKSFGSVNDNKYLNAMWRSGKK
ncbi:DUF2737 family protein [Shigella boydii]|nr:DUF2737 family protein [Shigella boydii]